MRHGRRQKGVPEDGRNRQVRKANGGMAGIHERSAQLSKASSWAAGTWEAGIEPMSALANPPRLLKARTVLVESGAVQRMIVLQVNPATRVSPWRKVL